MDLKTTTCLLLIANCSFICFQDYKERKVWLWCFISCALLGAAQLYLINNTLFIPSILINLIITGFIIICLFLYCYLKKIQLKNGIGLGDILFFIVIALSHPPVNFIILLSSSLIFSLVIYLLTLLFYKNHTLIPLAGHQALFFTFFYSYQLFSNSTTYLPL